MLPYTPVNQPRRLVLTAATLSAVLNAPIPGVESNVAEFRVPDGSMFTLVPDQPMRMYLQARLEIGRTAGAAGSNVNVDVTVNDNGRRMIKSARAQRTLPNLAHPDVIAYTLVTGGKWTPARVMKVDWDKGVVTVETPNNAGKIRVYYTFGDGEISLRAGRPFGSSTGQVQLYRVSARGLHETDQADRDAAPFAARTAQPLAPGFTLSLAVRAASTVFFDGLARHEISLPATETAINVSDPVMLADLAERQLKGV